MIDDKSFFHQGTMTICGSLDENRMIRDCEKYLQQFMPVEGIMLSTYEQGSRSIRFFAHSPVLPVPEGLRSIFLSPESQAFIHQDTENGVSLHSRKHSNPVSEDIGRALGISAFSAMVLHLKIDQEKLGVVQLFSNSHSEFTEEHARLLHLLHDPFAVALANVLRHREVLRLKDLLADDNRYLFQELRQISGSEIVGARYGLLEVMEQVRPGRSIEQPCDAEWRNRRGQGGDCQCHSLFLTPKRRPFYQGELWRVLGKSAGQRIVWA